ncbi:hypothetical protein [Streptacidiphilus rugosus]|uniref:hypothetical protein n=1 Tax=Streptacidiphilus rugosus TaxID=405783 RepID=UPI0005609824|nr:hypothetical protein [Streptacidiphilus rugosus]
MKDNKATSSPNRFRPGKRGRTLIAGLAGVGVLATGLALAAPQANAAEPLPQGKVTGCSGTCSETFKVKDTTQDLTATLVDAGNPTNGWLPPTPKVGDQLSPTAPGTHVWDMAYQPLWGDSTATVTYALTDPTGHSHGDIAIAMRTNMFGRGTVDSCVSNDANITCQWSHEGSLGFGTVDVYLVRK